MLHLYQSNQLESLASEFSDLIQTNPLNDIFTKEIVWVQSKGMGRYLNLYIAAEQGICAHIDFVLPASFIWQLMQQTIPEAPKQNAYAADSLTWRVLSLLQSGEFDQFTLIEHYLKLGDTAALDLANKVARLYDQYLVYRPNWIEAWTKDKLLDLGEDEIWQKALWQGLLGQTEKPHRVILWQKLLKRLPSAKLPQRIHVFGLASLAPMYLDLLNHIAQYTDIHLFTLNPSAEYWGDLIEAEAILKQPEDYQNLSLSGHPLLSSLGKQGQEFFDTLNELNIGREQEAFVESPPESLLALLQNDLLNLQLPQESPLTQHYLQDKSIQIHCTHTPLRELQILKDQLLAMLADNPELCMNDIAVLTPDIEKYVPFISAVFNKTGDETTLPFSITDTHLGHGSPLLSAFEELLNFFRNRFEVEHLLSLLAIEPICTKFELTKQDIEIIRHYIKQTNIHWGVDQNMRQLYGDDSDSFTWRSGLKRLALGFMIAPSPKNTYTPLWQNLAPDTTSSGHTEALSRLMQFVETLEQTYYLWQTPCLIEEWIERLQHLLEQFFAVDEQYHIALTQIERLFFDLSEAVNSAEYQEPIPYDLIRQNLNLSLSKKNDRNFLKSGITFCSMVPMRSLPFKVLCLIGLNDNDYPRDEKAVSFDLMTHHPQKGDRSRRNDDRYLFLEAIISARQTLYLSYLGKDIKTDEALAPSPLVNELLDTLATMTGYDIDTLTKKIVLEHPLQAFSQHYFNQTNPNLFSYQQQYAQALNQISEPEKSFLDIELDPPVLDHITSSDLLLFWRHPIRYWLKKNLGWQAVYLDETEQADEPFELDKQQENTVLRQLMQDKMNFESFDKSTQIFQAQNLFPVGELGKLNAAYEIDKIKALSIPSIFQEKTLPIFDFKLGLDKHTLTGTLTHLYPSGRAINQPLSLNAPEYITFLLNHLLLCATAPAQVDTKQSVLLTTNGQIQLETLPKTQAEPLLIEWLDYYCLGQTQILPFFPRTYLETARTYLEKKEKANAKEMAMNKAYSTFYGNQFQAGEAQYYKENELVFHKQDPLESPMFWEIMEKLLLPLLVLEVKA